MAALSTCSSLGLCKTYLKILCCRMDTPLTVTLRMDAISKTNGSMEGGTRLVIAGEGFGTDMDEVHHSAVTNKIVLVT